MAKWLDGVRWTHYCTLTFEQSVTVAGAKACFRRWIAALQASTCQEIGWYMVTEGRPRSRKLVHIHALLVIPGGLRISQLRSAWGNGIVKINRFRPGGNATDYCTKEACKDWGEYDLSENLDRFGLSQLGELTPIGPRETRV